MTHQEENLDSAKRLSSYILNIYPDLVFGISIWHENFTVNIVKPFKPLINPPLNWEGHPVNYK